MENHNIIDALDSKILTILLQNARIPFLEIARECGISGAAVHQRVQKLTKMGIISGSGINIDPKKLGYNTCAYIGVFLDKAENFDDVIEAFKNIPELTQCHYTTGQYAVFVKVYARDNEHLKDILSDGIQSIDGVSRTETFISLEEIFRRHLPVAKQK